MGEDKDSVIVRIEYMINNLLSPTPLKPIIDRVDHLIRGVSEKDYEPVLVSIGPIHRGKDHVKSMEQQKLRCLKQLVDRMGSSIIETLVSKLRGLEERARLCYPTSIGLDRDEFVEMMLLDGCFVIELIRNYYFGGTRAKNDHIIQSSRTLNQIRHDLMLLENQLPFFVLNELFNATKTNDPEDDISQHLLFFVDGIFPWLDISNLVKKPDVLDKVDHLLGLVYHSSSFSFEYSTKRKGQKQNPLVCISSASEMTKAGIRLKGSKEITLPSISFANGVMKFPTLNVSDRTESILRNLIAYEQCFLNDNPKCVTDYAFLMHCLVRSTKDVEVLRRKGIINNFIGSDDLMCRMINGLGKNVMISSDFCYSNVVASVDRHCRFRYRRWMTKLRKYCSIPLAIRDHIIRWSFCYVA